MSKSDLGLWDKAARAATALLVRRGTSPAQTAEVIHLVVKGKLGGASKVSRWARYGAHCSTSSTNRKWEGYAELKALTHKIAAAATKLL